MATSISSAENGHLAARLSDGRQFGAPKSLKLVHSVPGRVRLRVPRVAGDNPYAARLATLIEQHEAVDAVRVSAPTASIVIRHQPLISADEIRALVERQPGAACDPTVPEPEADGAGVQARGLRPPGHHDRGRRGLGRARRGAPPGADR